MGPIVQKSFTKRGSCKNKQPIGNRYSSGFQCISKTINISLSHCKNGTHPQAHQLTLIVSRNCMRQSFIRKQVSQKALEIILKWASSTHKQYSTALKSLWQFCQDTSSDCQTSIILKRNYDFMSNQKIPERCLYGTLNTLRSAISLVLSNEIGKDKIVTRFLTGCFKTRPSKPKYDYTWDVGILIKYLNKLHPLQDLALKELSTKTATLLTLSTVHRIIICKLCH